MSIRGADADFTLYEDEGDNYNYEKGAFSQIRFHWDDAARTLTIGERKGDYKGMLKKRNFRILVVNRQSLRVTKSRPNSVAPYVTTEKHKPSNCKNFQTTKRRTPLRFIIFAYSKMLKLYVSNFNISRLWKIYQIQNSWLSVCTILLLVMQMSLSTSFYF